MSHELFDLKVVKILTRYYNFTDWKMDLNERAKGKIHIDDFVLFYAVDILFTIKGVTCAWVVHYLAFLKRKNSLVEFIPLLEEYHYYTDNAFITYAYMFFW